jgi:hypothetical protein
MNRSTRALLLVGVLAATAAPAFADSVTVNASTTSASRQLKVLDMAGQPLSAVTLSPGHGQPFQVQVVDSGFHNLTSSNGFSVSATMNNLYKVTGTNTYDYGTSIPSSDLSIDYQTNPIRAFNPVASALGSVTIGGVLPTCSTTAGVSTVVGLPNLMTDILTANPLNGASLVTSLCNELTSPVTVANAGPVALPSATSVSLTSLLPSDLPFNLGSSLGTDYDKGPFTHADYSAGSIGASDSAAPGTWASVVTAHKLITGKAGLTSALSSAVTSALQGAINGLPLSSASGAGAVLPVASVISAVNNLGGTFATLAGTLSQIPAADATALLNKLTGTLGTPSLSDLSNVGQTSASLPIITYSGVTSVPTGNYQGTMTVTLVSS